MSSAGGLVCLRIVALAGLIVGGAGPGGAMWDGTGRGGLRHAADLEGEGLASGELDCLPGLFAASALPPVLRGGGPCHLGGLAAAGRFRALRALLGVLRSCHAVAPVLHLPRPAAPPRGESSQSAARGGRAEVQEVVAIPIPTQAPKPGGGVSDVY